MRPGRLFRHGLSLHRRGPQSDLPSRISNPAASVPQSIGTTAITAADPSATAPIATASAVSGLTTITEPRLLGVTSGTAVDTITTNIARTITNSAEYASLTSAAAASSSNANHTTSSTSGATTSSASKSNLTTLIPAIVIPVVALLLVSLAAFWFIMRRRHKKELKVQPEFVMTGKGEKLSSRSSSGRSIPSKQAALEKASPVASQRELPSAVSPPTTSSEWPSAQVGFARPQTPQRPYSPGRDQSFEQPRNLTANSPYRNGRGPGSGPRPGHSPGPATAARSEPPVTARDQRGNRSRSRSRSNSTLGQRAPPPPRSAPSPVSRTVPSPVPRSGPSPVPQHFQHTKPTTSPKSPPSAFRFRGPSPTMNQGNRAQAPQRLAAPPPGAYNGATSISQFSPIVKETSSTSMPSKRAPPPPLVSTGDLLTKGAKSPSSGSPPGHGLTDENVRIARLANSSRLGDTPAEPSPSPKLPPPATRSQLIPRESLDEPQDRFFGGNVSNPALSPAAADSGRYRSKRASVVSDADDYEDLEAKSDVSSLNEFERFDFGGGIGSGRGSPAGGSLTLRDFGAVNSPAASERESAFGTSTTRKG